MNRQTLKAMAGRDKLVGCSHDAEEFQRSWKNTERSCSWSTLCGAIDNPALHAVTCQFARHR
jgi:hypothetical protein